MSRFEKRHFHVFPRFLNLKIIKKQKHSHFFEKQVIFSTKRDQTSLHFSPKMSGFAFAPPYPPQKKKQTNKFKNTKTIKNHQFLNSGLVLKLALSPQKNIYRTLPFTRLSDKGFRAKLPRKKHTRPSTPEINAGDINLTTTVKTRKTLKT